MQRILKNYLWWIVPLVFMIMAISEILVAYFTIGRRYITCYFAVIEVIVWLLLISVILYCLIKKDTNFRIFTIISSLIMAISLVVMFRYFFLPHTIADTGLNKYLTFKQSAAFWYKIEEMETDRLLESGEYWLSERYIFVNINFIVAIVIGVATVLVLISPILNRILINNLWRIVPLLFMIMAISEILVAYFTIGHKYITGYFAIIEVIVWLLLIFVILYCLIKKDTNFRIFTIISSLIMVISLVVTFRLFSLPNAIASLGLNKYLTFGQSAAFWYRIDTMETDYLLKSGVYWLSDSSIFVNINFIAALVIGVSSVIIFINQILRRKKYEREN